MQHQTEAIGILDAAFATLHARLIADPYKLTLLTIALGKIRCAPGHQELALSTIFKVTAEHVGAWVQEEEGTRLNCDHSSNSTLDTSVGAATKNREDDHIEVSSGPTSIQSKESAKGEEGRDERNERNAVLRTSVVSAVALAVTEKKKAPLKKSSKVKPSMLPRMNKNIVTAIITGKRKRSDSPVDDETLQKKARYAEPTGIKTFVLPSQRMQEEHSASEINDEDDYIELPSICSQYSDDEDTDRHANEPSWSKGFVLISQLRRQQRYNPDLFFGPIDSSPEAFAQMLPQLARKKRTSSINWTVDGLTLLEAAEYDECMGYGRAALVA